MFNLRIAARRSSTVALLASSLFTFAAPFATAAQPALARPALALARPAPALRANSRANPFEENGAVCSPGTVVMTNFWYTITTPSETISVLAYGPAEWMPGPPGYWYSCGPYTKLQTIITYNYMQNLSNWNNTLVASLDICTGCLVSLNLPSPNITISQLTKKSLETVATLNTCSACTPAGIATDTLGNVYASMQASGPSSGPAVFLYAKGSTNPAGGLSLGGSASVTSAGIAVDPKGNVYWGTNAAGSGSGVIYRFAREGSGYGPAAGFAKAGSLGGIVYATKFGKVKGAILAAEPAQGEIAVYDSTGRQQQTVQTGGSPMSIGLGKNLKTLYVADPVNARLSAYSTTGASLDESGPMYVTDGSQTYLATVTGVTEYAPAKK